MQAGLFYMGMGMNEKLLGNYGTAKNYFEEGLVIFNRIRSLNFQLVMRSELGHVARLTGKLNDAKNIYHETLRGWQNMGHRGAIANQLECYAFIAIVEEEPKRAALLLGGAESFREKIQTQMTDHEQIEYGEFTIRLHTMLPETEFQSCWAQGRSMTMEQAIELALSDN